MSAPQPEPRIRIISGRLFRVRRPGPLLAPWIACLVIGGLIYYFELKMPAFHSVVKPLYWILGLILLVVTARALRARSGKRRVTERRHGDRRHGG